MTGLEHPDITRARRTGYGTRNADTMVCPVCGTEFDKNSTVYTLNIRGEAKIIGYNECVEAKTTADL